MPEIITILWNSVVFQPMLNGLLLLYGIAFNNFGITVILFTFMMRIILLPLTLRQLRAARQIATLQPELAKLQKRYAGDRQRLSQEQIRMYKEQGVNPLGCALPTLVQLPIWIGLYQSILKALAATPQDLMELSRHLYPGFSFAQTLVPLNSEFLWLDLALPDPVFVLPIVVGGSAWIQQKMATMPSVDPRQKQMNATMQWMMPMMFGFFTVSFASGLAIYWLISNVISIVIQYYVTGWGSLTWFSKTAPVTLAVPDDDATPALVEPAAGGTQPTQTRRTNGNTRSKRRFSRRGR